MKLSIPMAPVLALALAPALGACQAPSASASMSEAGKPAVPANARRVTSNGGTYVVAFVAEPDPIPVNEPLQLRVWVLEASGQQAQLAPDRVTLAVDAAMPEHQHGMNTEPVVKTDQDRAFLVSGMLLHMPGRWQLYFDVTQAGITERAQCDVTLE
jgi:hypothetical protein